MFGIFYQTSKLPFSGTFSTAQPWTHKVIQHSFMAKSVSGLSKNSLGCRVPPIVKPHINRTGQCTNFLKCPPDWLLGK